MILDVKARGKFLLIALIIGFKSLCFISLYKVGQFLFCWLSGIGRILYIFQSLWLEFPPPLSHSLITLTLSFWRVIRLFRAVSSPLDKFEGVLFMGVPEISLLIPFRNIITPLLVLVGKFVLDVLKKAYMPYTFAGPVQDPLSVTCLKNRLYMQHISIGWILRPLVILRWKRVNTKLTALTHWL